MDFNPSVTHKHVLFSLLFTGEEPAMSKTTPALNVKQRKELVEAGFIELEKRGRAFHVILTDKAWAWAFDSFGQEISAKLKLNAKALEGLLKRLKTYMVKNNVGLADFLACDCLDPDGAQSGVPEPGSSESHMSEYEIAESGNPKELESRIRSAYHRLAGNKWNVRVPIAELRKALSDIEKDDLSALLRQMQLSDEYTLVLYPYDDPREITPEDVAAAVHIAGQENHIVYMGQ